MSLWQYINAAIVMKKKVIVSPENAQNMKVKVVFLKLKKNNETEGKNTVLKRGFIRSTKQRELILKTLRNTKSHPTADWIYEEVKKEIPNISLGTIYRNLNTLKEMGEILELSYGSKYSRYDGNPQNHYHFVCVDCGNVYDIEGCPVQMGLDEKVAEENDVEVYYHRMEFYGLCSSCKDKK